VQSVLNQTQAAATTAIQGAQLIVGTLSQQSSVTVPAGSVISQSPSAGTSLAAGSAVSLVVSTGPVATPNVVNQTEAAATAALTGAGLAVGTVTRESSATVPSGSVISQSPASGANVASGSAVALVVSTGPSTPTTPPPTNSGGGGGGGSMGLGVLAIGLAALAARRRRRQ
jgi:MYXO-CTERM domain-containing protein